MTNYYGTGRTNYFAVKDIEAFKAEMKPLTALEIVTEEKDGQTLVGLISNYEGGFVWDYENPETEDYEEFDWAECFKKHLQDDWVAIITEAGSEGVRYVSGVALAYNNKGQSTHLYLEDIVEKALNEGLGTKITKAEY